jgi:proline iminopeptidase
MRNVLLALAAFLLLTNATWRDLHTGDGVTIRYRLAGSGEPVIVLAGGPGCSGDYMMPVAEHLAAKVQAAVPDERGTGVSVVDTYDEKTISLATYINDIDELRVQLHAGKVTVVGHSWGGMLAMIYAAAHPEHVKALVLFDSGGPTLEFGEQFTKNLEARYTDEDRKQLEYWRDPARKAANPRHAVVAALAAKTPAYFADRAKGAAYGAAMTDYDYEPRVNKLLFAELGKKYDVREAMKSLHVPVLLVQGKEDPIATVDILRATFPEARVAVIERAGHFPWLEQPDAVWAAVDSFFATLK